MRRQGLRDSTPEPCVGGCPNFGPISGLETRKRHTKEFPEELLGQPPAYYLQAPKVFLFGYDL